MFNMFGQTVTLYIDDTSIRLLTVKRQRVRKWAEVKLEPGLVKGAVVLKQPEVTAHIKHLLTDNEVKSKKVVLGFSGLHTLTRPITVPDLPRAMLTEAVAREARRVLPVPLDQLYLSWRLVSVAHGQCKAFIAANPRAAVDSMMKTVRAAGLDVVRMTIKPLALTKIVPDNTAIIVDLQANEFDIVIVSEGIPQPIRTINLPETELTAAQKVEEVIKDLDRTLKFFDSNNPEKPLAKTAVLYVSGELVGQPDLQKSLADAAQHPVRQLTATLKNASQLHPARSTANVAMAVKSAMPGREDSFGVADLNLLPGPYQPKPISFGKLMVLPSAAALAGVVVPMLMLMQASSANIQSLHRDIDKANAAITQKVARQNQLKAEIAGLETQIAAAKRTYDGFQASVNYLAVQQKVVETALKVVLDLKPDGVTIAGILWSADGLEVRGEAVAEKDVLVYARSLDKTGEFAETVISSLRRVEIEATEEEPASEYLEFTLRFRMKNAEEASGNRYSRLNTNS